MINLTSVVSKKPLTKIKSEFSKASYPVISRGQDSLSFSTPVIKRANKKEKNKAICLFLDAILKQKHNNYYKSKILNYINITLRKIIFSKLYIAAISSPDDIVEVVKVRNKVVAGFSLEKYKDKNTGYINFLTIKPEFKGTKTSAKLLLTMGKRILEIAKANNYEHLMWVTNNSNKRMSHLANRLNAEKQPIGEFATQYSIKVDDFAKAIDKLSS